MTLARGGITLPVLGPRVFVPRRGFYPGGDTFDGTNDFMARGAGITGLADGKAGTISAWVSLLGGDGANQCVRAGNSLVTTNRFQLFRGTTNLFGIRGRNAAGTLIMSMNTVATYLAGGGWKHIFATWDLASGLGSLLVNGVADLAGSPTLTNDTIDYTEANAFVGSASGTTSLLNGSAAEVWFHPSYLGAAAVTSFIKDGRAVDLGPDGSWPLGSQPIEYHSLRVGDAATAFATNRGSGGNFAITGALDLVAGPNG